MTGVTGATLDKLYESWPTTEGHTCTVAFQKKHWFDKHITLRWLEWLKKQFPIGSKLLLIWDHAPAHDAAEVSVYLKANTAWLVVKVIPGGLTSVMQICDLTANAQLKRDFQFYYMEWRSGELCKLQEAYEDRVAEADGAVADPPKPVLKRDRRAIIRMVEQAFAKFNAAEVAKPLAQRCIRKTFAQAGQDPWAADTTAFKQHLDALESNPVYGVLTPKQVRHIIEDQLLANQMAQLQL